MAEIDFRSVAKVVWSKALGKPFPFRLVFEVTHLCNLECNYCDRHTPKPNELSFEQIDKIIDEFVEIGLKGVTLDGGDPLARRDIDKIINKLHLGGLFIALNTNAILIPKKIETVKKVSKVVVSLDGPELYHDSMRGKGSFLSAVKGIRRAREEGVLVKLRCVLHKENVDSVPELVQIAQDLDAPIMFQPATNSLFLESDRDGTNWEPPVERFLKTVRWLADQKKKNRYIENHYASLQHFLSFPEGKKLPCSAGWISVTLDPQGYLYHCGKIDRTDQKVSVVQLGAKKAFENIARYGCDQCWCASQVDANYAWGIQLHKFTRIGTPSVNSSSVQ